MLCQYETPALTFKTFRATSTTHTLFVERGCTQYLAIVSHSTLRVALARRN